MPPKRQSSSRDLCLCCCCTQLEAAYEQYRSNAGIAAVIGRALRLSQGLSAPESHPWRACQAIKFGKFDIQTSEIFTETSLSFAFVNLKPVVPGHLLVSPKRVVPRFCDLNQEEVADCCMQALQDKGHHVEATSWGAVVQGILADPSDGYLTGVSDPRKDGAPAGL